MADEVGELVVQALLERAQLAVDDDGARRLEARAHRAAAGLASLFFEPAQVKAVMARDFQQARLRQRHFPPAGRLGSTFDVGKVVLVGLLPDANEQPRELRPRRAGLHQQFRQCVLQATPWRTGMPAPMRWPAPRKLQGERRTSHRRALQHRRCRGFHRGTNDYPCQTRRPATRASRWTAHVCPVSTMLR